jgi:tetratricopeptide (TPR) repeat protein
MKKFYFFDFLIGLNIKSGKVKDAVDLFCDPLHQDVAVFSSTFDDFSDENILEYQEKFGECFLNKPNIYKKQISKLITLKVKNLLIKNEMEILKKELKRINGMNFYSVLEKKLGYLFKNEKGDEAVNLYIDPLSSKLMHSAGDISKDITKKIKNEINSVIKAQLEHLLHENELDQAVELLESLRGALDSTSIGVVFDDLIRTKNFEKLKVDEIENLLDEHSDIPGSLPLYFAHQGDLDEAIKWLKKSDLNFSENLKKLLHFYEGDPSFKKHKEFPTLVYGKELSSCFFRICLSKYFVSIGELQAGVNFLKGISVDNIGFGEFPAFQKLFNDIFDDLTKNETHTHIRLEIVK